MINKIRVDLSGKKTPYDMAANSADRQLGYYYFKFKESPKKLNRLIIGLDANGIPVNASYIDVETPRQHHYPISIGQYGLAIFHTFLDTGNEEKKVHFLKIAEWFMDNSRMNDELGRYWLTEIPKPEYRITQGWKSAFTQSRAISILLRAWQLTSDERYLQFAVTSLLPFTKDIREGGVTANLYEKHPFYEEYAAAEPTMVLDGHIFALFGLHECMRAVTPDIDPKSHHLARNLFSAGIESLLYFLPEYDLGYWLRFNLCRMPHYSVIDPCTVGYLRLVAAQLHVLAKLTNNNRLTEWYHKVKQYDRPANILRMYKIKYHALKQLNRI